jgi:hypothetical protein
MPGTNRIVTWDTTGDTLTEASIKINNLTFKNADNNNIITFDPDGFGNTGVGVAIFGDITTGIADTVMGTGMLAVLITGQYNAACGFNSLGNLITGQQNTCRL